VSENDPTSLPISTANTVGILARIRLGIWVTLALVAAALAAFVWFATRDQPLAAAALRNADAHFSAGRFGEAIAKYAEAIVLAPNSHRAYNRRARLNLEAGDVQGARDDADAALRRSPNYAQASYTLSLILRQNGDIDDAERELLKAKKIDPNVADRW
jgi:tetratricopeptide (TPR) repeat protein